MLAELGEEGFWVEKTACPKAGWWEMMDCVWRMVSGTRIQASHFHLQKYLSTARGQPWASRDRAVSGLPDLAAGGAEHVSRLIEL